MTVALPSLVVAHVAGVADVEILSAQGVEQATDGWKPGVTRSLSVPLVNHGVYNVLPPAVLKILAATVAGSVEPNQLHVACIGSVPPLGSLL